MDGHLTLAKGRSPLRLGCAAYEKLKTQLLGLDWGDGGPNGKPLMCSTSLIKKRCSIVVDGHLTLAKGRSALGLGCAAYEKLKT